VREHLLDVSDLPPPEPLEQCLAALEVLPPGVYLRVLHRREPYLLYPILDEGGFAYVTVTGERAPLEIFIWRRGDAAAEDALRQDSRCEPARAGA
jgi:hypothetical protein